MTAKKNTEKEMKADNDCFKRKIFYMPLKFKLLTGSLRLEIC